MNDSLKALKEQKILRYLSQKLQAHVDEIVLDQDGIWIYFDQYVVDLNYDLAHTLHAESIKDMKEQLKGFKTMDDPKTREYMSVVYGCGKY